MISRDLGNGDSCQYTGEKEYMENEKSDEERKLVRKITWSLIPWFCAIEVVQLTDKQILSSAAVMGLFEDTGITQAQFSLLGSILYAGILACQAPNAYLMQKLPISKYFGAAIFCWGAVVALTALCSNFGGLVTVRLLLGFLEATVYPCIFLLISTLYRRSEQVIWYGVVIISSEITSIISGLAIYGIGHMNKLAGISGWKWCQILWGSMTVLVGIGVFLFLPDKPKSRWFRLTPVEQHIVDERTRDNAVVRSKQFKLAHVVEALKELRLYCYSLAVLCLDLQSGGLGLYGAVLIKDMGFTVTPVYDVIDLGIHSIQNLEALSFRIPGSVVSVCIICTSMYFSHRFQEIGYVGATASFISFIGVMLLRVLPNGPAKLCGLYLCAVTSGYVMIVTSTSSNVSGYTKKIFYNGFILVAGCAGNFIGPLLMVEEDSPHYTRSLYVYMVADLVAIVMLLIVRWIHASTNSQKKKLREQGRVHMPVGCREDMDLTDKEDPFFEYRL